MKTPISYYGGKQSMLPIILPLIPAHNTYTEAFFGGGAVYWGKKPAKNEIVNDHNGNVVNFYNVLSKDYEALKNLLDTTLHSRDTYKYAMVIYSLPWLFSEVQRAWAFWYCTNAGFSNIIGSWTTNPRGPIKIQNRIESLTRGHAERIKNTSIEQTDACDLIARHDSNQSFHYVDPPYVDADQGHYGGYTQKHFDRLIDTLSKCKGKFLLSSYDNPTLAEYVEKMGWSQKRLDLHNASASKAGRRKVEVLTANYPLE